MINIIDRDFTRKDTFLSKSKRRWIQLNFVSTRLLLIFEVAEAANELGDVAMPLIISGLIS